MWFGNNLTHTYRISIVVPIHDITFWRTIKVSLQVSRMRTATPVKFYFIHPHCQLGTSRRQGSTFVICYRIIVNFYDISIRDFSAVTYTGFA